MDLDLSPSERAFQAEFRAWLEENIQPEWREDYLRGLPHDEAWKHRRAFEQSMGDAGWLGVAWPVEYGGRGASLVEQALYQEELVEARVSYMPGAVGLQLVAPMLMAVGTDEQRERYLTPILRGREVWYQGFSEPNAGSDLAGLQTRAVLDGDEWVVTGQKVWGGGAQHADWGAVLARTDPNAPKHRGISFLIVPMRSPGITVSYIKEMGGRAELNEVFFDGVRIPAENVLGPVNAGWKVANSLLGYERGVMTIAYAHRYLRFWRELRDHASKTRRHGQLLIDQPHIRTALASTYAKLTLMRLANLRWVTHYVRGAMPREETSYMKLYWADAEQSLADLALEVGGGSALALPEDEELSALRNGEWAAQWMLSRAVTILGGTQDIQRNIIAERILGLPRGI